MIYKVWISIEEIDDDDHYEDVGLPVSVAEFSNEEAAQQCVEELSGGRRTDE